MNTADKLRKMLTEQETILVPGCYDAWSAKILKQAGFNLIYMSGSALTASLTGLPDIGFLTMTEMVTQARNIVNATGLPLICDADNGYGNALNVWRTIREYERAGVAGVHLEDQVIPKRCGHFEGKALIPASEMVGKIRAALDARRSEDFLIIARTDARSVEGLDAAIQRARLYHDAGADMIFLESPRSAEEIRTISRELNNMHLLINLVEGGKTPLLPFEELRQMGFKIVLYPTAAIRITARALKEFASHLADKKDTIGLEDRMISFEERNRITGLANFLEAEKRYKD